MGDFEIKNGILKKYGGNDSEVIIPDNVIRIGIAAFSGCSSLQTVIIPEGVREIQEDAFSGCRNLTKVILPESLEIIGFRAFGFCENLPELTIPERCKKIAYWTFVACPKLKITYHGRTFSTAVTKHFNYINEIFAMLENQNFTARMPLEVKYSALWSEFNPQKKALSDYIRKHFTKMCRYLIDENNTETIRKVLADTDFVTKKNVNSLIQYAIDKKRYEIQLMLMVYKSETLGYEEIDKTIGKKLKL